MQQKFGGKQATLFQNTVWEYYASHKREFPWRENIHPYRILVSEIMLQQTQTSRVVGKFEEFLERFPDIYTLAHAPQAKVLQAWQGLGYNRRARFLHQTARMICEQHEGTVPHRLQELVSLPGIGTNTAGSITVFAYNTPAVFIETNIRSVFLYWFFPEQSNVSDKNIFSLIEQTLYQDNPREWYWALMDYGVFLKQQSDNPSRRSRHHKQQTPFVSSKRKVRGEVIRLLTNAPHTYKKLEETIDDPRLYDVLSTLEVEQLITRSSGTYRLAE